MATEACGSCGGEREGERGERRRRVRGDEGVEMVRDRREEVSLMLGTITAEEKVEAGGAGETV